MSWVMIIIPTFSSLHRARMRSRIWAWIETSRAVVGSSAMITSGSAARASAITTRWRMPPENWWGCCFTRSSGSGIPTCRRRSPARRLAAASPVPRWRSMVSTSCCSMVWRGFRLVSGSWKIIPIRLPRSLRFSASSRSSMRLPARWISPAVISPGGSRSPMTAFPTVDLPAPDSPTTPRMSPGSTASDTSSTATRLPRRLGNSTRRFRMSRRAVAVATAATVTGASGSGRRGASPRGGSPRAPAPPGRAPERW